MADKTNPDDIPNALAIAAAVILLGFILGALGRGWEVWFI